MSPVDFDDYEKTLDGKAYRLSSPLQWEIGQKGSGWVLVVPAGYVFESSIPWWLTWLISRDHRPWLLAAAIHDRLFDLGYDKAFASGEWLRAVRAVRKRDRLKILAVPAYYALTIWTVR